MADPIIPVVTLAGLAAAFAADNNGLQVEFTHIALGDGQWTPTNTAIALQNEITRVPIAAGQFIPPNQLHLSALADQAAEFWVNEFAIIGDGNIVMAIWSNPGTPIAYKSSQVDLVLNWDLILHAFPPDSITVSNITTDLNLTLVSEYAEMATAILQINLREIQDLVRTLANEARLTALELA